MTAPRVLTKQELEQFDPQGGRGGGAERDWLCPLCGEGKPQDKRHRSLSANLDTGAWRCHRCGESGLLKEFWTDLDEAPKDKNTRARANLRRRFEVRSSSPAAVPSSDWRRRLPQLIPLLGTPGADYLLSRGIPLDLAHAAGVRYAPRWEHWAKEGERWELEGVSRRVVVSLRDRSGGLMAIQGRAIADDEFGCRMMSRGNVKEGVFITPGALDGELLVIAEAPIDALSLFVCGLPAVGTTGINALPDWLVKHGVRKRVLVATDADPEGDRAAGEWAERFGWARQVERLQPAGAKDWNEMLQGDPDALRALCNAAVGEPAAWDGSAAWEMLVAAQRQAGGLVPEGGIGWAETSRPDLLEAVDVAEQTVNAAFAAEDRAALGRALRQFEEAHRAMGAEFRRRSTTVDTDDQAGQLDDAALRALFSEG